MSIIYDALRKIEKKVPTPQQAAGRKIAFYLLFASVALCGFFLAGLISTASVRALAKLKPPKTPVLTAVPRNQAPAAPVIAPATAPVAAEAATQAAAAAAAAHTELTLNGVVFSEEDGYALINNQIVREGDTIGNAKVTAVAADGVELDIAGKPVKLTLQK
jgi:hypothetical protein